jgi:hypothetical protein
MPDYDQIVRNFFRRYAKRMNDALKDPPKVDTDGVVAAFAEYFVGAAPSGVRGGKNGVLFRLMISRGMANYRKLGMQQMLISSVKTTRLDPLHFMAKVSWDSRYISKTGVRQRIKFQNIYMLQLQRGKPRIFAYITGDEQQALKDHGLI